MTGTSHTCSHCLFQNAQHAPSFRAPVHSIAHAFLSCFLSISSPFTYSCPLQLSFYIQPPSLRLPGPHKKLIRCLISKQENDQCNCLLAISSSCPICVIQIQIVFTFVFKIGFKVDITLFCVWFGIGVGVEAWVWKTIKPLLSSTMSGGRSWGRSKRAKGKERYWYWGRSHEATIS